MATYRHPGVYVEEIPGGSRPIEGISTSVAAFLGYAVRGNQSVPTLLFRWDDYVNEYGGLRPTSDPRGDSLGHAVRAFFQNGGSMAYVIRLARNTVASEGFVLHPEASETPMSRDQLIRFVARNDGTWGDRLRVRFISQGAVGGVDRYTVAVDVLQDGEYEEKERLSGLTLDDTRADFIEAVVNADSVRVRAEVQTVEPHLLMEHAGAESLAEILADSEAYVALDGGDDGDPGQSAEYDAAFAQLCLLREVSILCLPGQHWASDGSGNAILDSAIAHAEKMRNRMVIIDPPPEQELTKQAAVHSLKLPTSAYSVLYYPWVDVANPFYTAAPEPGAPRVPSMVQVPPCGFAAGIWARTDAQRGVWKAPAGGETGLLGVAGLEHEVEDSHQQQLNPLGVNCFRRLPSLGTVVWGARTLATQAKPEWRYLPVRRTAIFIEQSLYNGIQWAVFEPNNEQLWSSLRVNIESFMQGLYRAGAFQGSTVQEAYFVQCGLGNTMTQGDIDLGRVIVQVGFAPLKPAEFFIIRLQQKVGRE